MGASISGPEKGTRVRGMNADLNLVPFIDLLSVCITFLLLTAVWTQVQALAIDQGVADPATETTDADVPLTVHLSADVSSAIAPFSFSTGKTARTAAAVWLHAPCPAKLISRASSR